MAEKKEATKKPIYKKWWFWAIAFVLIISCVVTLILAVPQKKEKEYISPEKLSSNIEKQRQDAIQQQKESTIKIVEATKEAVIAYKDLHGDYPAKLNDIDGWDDNWDVVEYYYNGVDIPTIYYYSDGEKVGESVE